jgi:hypothetical protein
MKGIYLTEEGKKSIEDRIVKLHEDWKGKVGYNMVLFNIDLLKEILSSATILPVEEDWDDAMIKAIKHQENNGMEILYPNGVIIKSKQ